MALYYHINFVLSVQEKKCEIDFQDSGHSGHLGLLIGTILQCSSFFIDVTLMFLPGLESICLSVQAKKRKIDFQDGSQGGHLGFPIRMNLAILIYLSPRCFLSSLKTIGLLYRRSKNFQVHAMVVILDFKMVAMAAILDFGSELFSYFCSTRQPDASYQVSSQSAFRFKRRSKTRFSR